MQNYVYLFVKEAQLEKFWQQLSILITIESLFLGSLYFAPFLILESNSYTSQKTAFKISFYQYTAISFVCFLSLFLFLYAVPYFIKQQKSKKTHQALSNQILLLNESAKSRREMLLLIEKLQHITKTAPELILKMLRYYSMQSRIDADKNIFSPAQQAGIVISCLDTKSLKRIFKRMQKTEINLFQQLIQSLGYIFIEDKIQVLSKFLDTLTEPANKIENPHFSDNILPYQQAINILKKENIPPSKANIWNKLEQITSEKIAAYLKNESAQSIAIILYNLSDKKSGEILNHLPKDISCSALSRLTALKSLSKKRFKNIEIFLESYFLNITPQAYYHGWEKASSILSLMPPKEKNKLIFALTETNPQITQKLAQHIIYFNDLANWNNNDIQKLIKKTPENVLSTALLGANNKTKEIFLKNITPQHWGAILKQTFSSQSEKIKEIDEAQYFVIKKAHVLMSQKRK